jgi:hypothetical protein
MACLNKYTLLGPIIFADDTIVLNFFNNIHDFCSMSNSVCSLRSNWFTANKLIQNLNKTNVMKSVNNNSPFV